MSLSSKPTELILALDQGTTNTKALLVDAQTGVVLYQASRTVEVRLPAPGEVEQDGEQIWDTTLAAAAECLSKVDGSTLAGVAISNQRESVAMWEKDSGALLGPVLGWQDARTASQCQEVANSAGFVRRRTGLSLDPMYSAPKMRWLLDRSAPGSSPCIGTVDSFLLSRLTGRFVTEAGNASRTLLFNLESLAWDPDLLEVFGIPAVSLPEVTTSDGEFGRVRSGLPIPEGTPILAVMADSHAALYCHGQGRGGEGKATYGTGSSVMVPTSSREPGDGVATTLAWYAGSPVYAREGNILASGAALSLMARILTDGDVSALGELAARAPTDHGVDFVPAFSGLAAPYFDRGASGLIAGITGAMTPEILARAAFDAVAHQVADVVEAIEADGHAHLGVLHADGGATVSDLLMSTQADLLKQDVHVASTAEASALGAARLAATRMGVSTDAGWLEARPRIFTPSTEDTSTDRERWKRSVRRSRGLATH